jgi:hypothetical protein
MLGLAMSALVKSTKRTNITGLLSNAVILLLLFQLGAIPAAAAQDQSPDHLHSVIPLGAESLLLMPERHPVLIIASAISPQFEGWYTLGAGPDRRVLASDNAPVAFFPERIQFRVTASAHEFSLLTDSYPIELRGDLNQLLLNLHFTLKVFDGLHASAVEPASVEIIGVPPDVSYDERVYLISFAVGQIPVSRRLVLEVLDPEGQRLCKFHLDLE